ncbi:Hypothetical Protein SLY_0257 [Strawberry lethal yellows phytoplasma (CPA) str. NZSb11]|uniref:Uncharacterized protein n=2 Tax=Phytoplasma australiense TaxID=59748 RepID=R4S051_PHYAS|nr:Hypothetical Protein SLY_0257 [Strawberry lethal yellows phytoplasma (CPA) str. NZSb11]
MKKIVDSCMQQALTIINENKTLLDEIVLQLMEKETLNEKDMQTLLI